MSEPADRTQQVLDNYHTTLRVLAVVIERLFQHTGSHVLVLSEADLIDSPDLIARLDKRTRALTLTVER